MEPNDISSLLNSEADICINTNTITLSKPFFTANDAEEEVKKVKRESLTTKNALKFLLEGRLKKKVCRYCLHVAHPLSELDQVLEIGGTGVMYKITIRDMVASFHPFKVADDPNFPNRICNKCLNRTISSYLFTQQCDRSERALRNCFEDMYNKLDKLDPLEPKQRKRGRQKAHPNYNILFTDHAKVIDYAEPIINIVNLGAELLDPDEIGVSSQFECLKCSLIFPNVISLSNHEKLHPKSMYYHCRYCGKSFTKRNLLKRHRKVAHEDGKPLQIEKTDFKCTDCNVVSQDYGKHLQHVEKHKFLTVMEHLIERNMDKLCAVCLNKNRRLEDMDKMVCLHGGYPEMMGDRTLYNILGSTVPEMNILHNYTGTKICEKCLNHAITSYVFIQQTQYIRNRLKTCISVMLDNLNKVQEPESNLLVEVSQEIVMPIVEQEFDENILLNEEEVDESQLKIEVLEDEFRLESESEESETESNELKEDEYQKMQNIFGFDITKEFTEKQDSKEVFDFTAKSDEFDVIFNPAKQATKTYEKKKLYNGIQTGNDRNYSSLNICSEFLTFKKKKKPIKRFYNCKFTCPLCNKHFVSDYFLKRHILKHIHKKVQCKLCNDKFKSKFYLYEHMKMIHMLKQNDFSSCEVCGRTFVDNSKLDRHIHCHLTKECQLCNKTFTSQKHYDSHMQRHVVKLKILKDRRAQTCSFCEKECSNDNELSVHVNKVHLQIKPYGCDMCDRQFYTESNLTSHKRVHSLFSKETCEFCGKVMKCRKDLVVHVRKHIGVQPHACPVCNQTFYSSGKVKMHMALQHGGTFCCKLCKCVLKNKSGLRLHITVAHNII